MGDRIELRALQVNGICGALPEEKERRQPLEINITIDADLSAACSSDDLTQTIDYGAICDIVERVVTSERFVLLERLAQRLFEALEPLCRPTVEMSGADGWVEISVRKLRPPVPQSLATSGVRIRRELR